MPNKKKEVVITQFCGTTDKPEAIDRAHLTSLVSDLADLDHDVEVELCFDNN